MFGVETAHSVFATFGGYVVAGFLGITIGSTMVVILRYTRAAWTWGVMPPVVTVLGLPSIHSSEAVMFGGLIATAITMLWMAFKGDPAKGEFGLRDALAKKGVRIAVSVYFGYSAIYALLNGPAYALVLAVGLLIAIWWNRGLRELLHEATKLNS